MNEFEAVYRAYFKDVFLYIKSLSKNDDIAEEITAEAFFKAMQSLKNFDGRCEIRVWLCQIAKNCYFSYLRKNRRYEDIENIEETAQSSVSEDILEKLDDGEQAAKLHKILHNIEEPYKEVFTLRVFGELSFKQIGAIFGKSENWACVTYHRCAAKIKAHMEEKK